MNFGGTNLTFPDSLFLLLRNLIHEQTGIFFHDDKHDLLIDKLSPLVIDRGFQSPIDYYYLLKYDSDATEEWSRLLDAITVPETFFWREMDQVRALVDTVVPKYFFTEPGQALRIWSAACATGEEPLTIAMALNEAGWFRRAEIEIYASDVSANAIKRARAGIYQERSFRALDSELRDKYFIDQGKNHWQIAPELHSRVTRRQANLLDEAELSFFPASPIIFCRNVFIYFSQDAIRKTVKMFARRMPTPAYLFVAASESLLRVTNDFELTEIDNAFVYLKND